jgi:uncharacterized membrane protein YagU involved in acid resistance
VVSVRRSRAPASSFQLAAIGIVGGVVAAFVMDSFGRAVRAANDGREAEGAAPGRDRGDRGVQPPQSEGRAEDDAAVQMGALAYRALTGHDPSAAARPWLGTAAHYGFSISASMPYVLLAELMPQVRAGFGTMYGSVVWAVADEGVTPALGLSRGPRELSPNVLLYGLCGHFVWGATLEAVRRLGGFVVEPSQRRLAVAH